MMLVIVLTAQVNVLIHSWVQGRQSVGINHVEVYRCNIGLNTKFLNM